MKNIIFSRKELLFLITISFALGIRQMAMTMVMPFISTYSKTLTNSNAALAGVALGIFGLTQAIFQIPFGILSDKIGNKPVLLIGLMQVILGLIIAFAAKSIYVLIFARALQGSGAVLATGYSWVTSSVKSEKRPRALSILGMIIGFAASASFALGPLIHNYLSVRQMFLICAIFISCVWLIILLFLKSTYNSDSIDISRKSLATRNSIIILLKNKMFLALNLAAFFNNLIMAGVFYTVPQYLDKITGINGMWKIFMPSVIIAIIYMRKTVQFIENGYSPILVISSFFISAIGICFYFNNKSFYFILIGSILFMTSYISLSTIIPTLANDIAENSYRGTANGIINSFQYIGSFVGAVVIGILWDNHNNAPLLLMIIISILGIVTVKGKIIVSNKRKNNLN